MFVQKRKSAKEHVVLDAQFGSFYSFSDSNQPSIGTFEPLVYTKNASKSTGVWEIGELPQ